jgi:ribosome biogenesis protein Nip4
MQAKKKMLKLKPLTREDYKIVTSMLSRVVKCQADRILPGKLYGQYGGPHIDIYSLSEDMELRARQLLSHGINPYSAGLYTAMISKNRKIIPSLDLAKHIWMQCTPTEYRHTVVNEAGEKIFLYGKDVFHANIVQTNTDSGLTIVTNMYGEPLGWGFLKRKNGKELLIENIKDVGWYVRAGG